MTCSLTNIPFSKEAKFRTKNKINSIYKSIYLDMDIYLYVDLHIYVCVLSHLVVSDSPTPWTAAYQAPPSMGFSRQEYWSGVTLPSPLRHCRQILYHMSHQGSPYIYLNPYIYKSINRYIPISRHMDNIKFKSMQCC